MKKINNHKLTTEGLQILGAGEALKKNIEQYPTYDDLLKRHTDYFKVKEKMQTLHL